MPVWSSDKGEQCLAGGSGLSLAGENINTGKEAQYLKTLRKREEFPPIFVFSHGVQRLGKARWFKVIVPPRLRARARSMSDSSQFSQPTSVTFVNALGRPLWEATILIQPSWIKAQKKEPTCMLQVWFQKTPEHTFSLYLNPIKISSISAHI